jgi:epoxyqueuosine reductase QueG
MVTESQRLAELASNIKGLAGASTADLVGIAPGSEFSAEELGDLGEVFGEVKSIVVLAQRITDPIQVVRFYTGSVYRGSRVATSFADAMLKSTCWQVVEVLRQAGVRAAAPRNLRYGDAAPRHSLSFKKAAVLAGFGAFGRNQLVIHPKWGPWMMLRTVVTDAPLPPDEQVGFSPCDGCGQCIEACPSGALSDNGIERDVCDQVVGYRGPDSATVVRLSAHGQINCEECLRACPIGEAPPRLQLGEM